MFVTIASFPLKLSNKRCEHPRSFYNDSVSLKWEKRACLGNYALSGVAIAGAFRAGKNMGFTLLCTLSGYQITKWPYSELHRGWLKADTILLFPISGGDTLEG